MEKISFQLFPFIYLFIVTVIIAHTLTPTELQHYEGVKTSK